MFLKIAEVQSTQQSGIKGVKMYFATNIIAYSYAFFHTNVRLTKALLQFTRHATKALRRNGFVGGPNSAGSFYVLSYYTLL